MSMPGEGKLSLKALYDNSKGQTIQMRRDLANHIALAGINRWQVLLLHDKINNYRDAQVQYLTGANTNGLTDYARVQERDPSLDLESELSQCLVAVDAILDWVVANYPATASGDIAPFNWVNKRAANIDLTGPQLTAYKNRMTAFYNRLG